MSLRRQTLWSMMPILVTSVISVASVPLYFRFLGEEMYAIWFYVGTLTGAFGFMDLGLGVAVGRFMGVAMGRDDKEAVKEYWSSGHAVVFPFVVAFAIIFIVIGTGWGPTWFKVEPENAPTLRWAMLWGGLGLFFNYYGQMWNILTMTYLDFKFVSILRTRISVATAGGSVLVAILTSNVAWVVAYGTGVSAIMFFLLFRRGSHHYKLPVRLSDFRKSRLLEMLPYTLKTFGQLLSGSILGSLDRLFLGRMAPTPDFAAFNVSLNISSRISGLSIAVMQPMFCNATRGVGGDVARHPAKIYRDGFAMTFPWCLLICIGAAFWSEPAIYLWLGPVNAPAVATAFPWVLIALSMAAMANISGAQLGPLDRVGLGLVFQTIVSLLSLLGVVVGWSLAGLSGAAMGFCLARAALVIQDVWLRRIIGIPPGEYFALLPIFFRQILIVGGVWSVARFFPQDHLSQTIFAAIAALLSGSTEVYFAFQASKKVIESKL